MAPLRKLNFVLYMCAEIGANTSLKLLENVSLIMNFSKRFGLFYAAVFFLPFGALQTVIEYLKEKIMPKVPVGSKVKFRKFLDTYLIKFYFSPTATFPHANWSYFHDINDFGKFNMSTNSAEVINRKLKRLAGNGKISFPTACRKLKQFKEEYLGAFMWKVNFDNLNPRRQKVIRREDNLTVLVREFSDSDWFNSETIIFYAKKFATVDSVSELIPSNDLQQNDHSDIGPDQTIPNFNETVYTQL